MGAGDPVTPGKSGTTTTTQRQDRREQQGRGGTTTTTPQFPSTAQTGGNSTAAQLAEALRMAMSGGGDDLDAKVAQLRTAILTGEDVSLGSFGDATVRDVDQVAGPRGGVRTTTRNRTVTDMLNDLARMDEDELIGLQERLYEAGYYNKAFYENPTENRVDFGNRYDQATRRAFGLLLADGLAFSSSSLDEILRDRAKDFESTGRTAAGDRTRRQGQVGGGKLYETVIDDPVALGQLADEVAISVLGRTVSDEDRAKYAHLVQGKQRSAAAKQHAAEEANTRRNFDADIANADANVRGSNADLLNPVSGGTFSDTLGAPRDGGSRKHRGTDIFGQKGAPVVAPVSGTIVRAGNDGGKGGNRVWIKGDDGRAHYLSHLDSITLTSGRVEAGQQIGTVGNTGNAATTAPHVHYSINSKVGTEDAVGNPAKEIGTSANSQANTSHAEDVYLAPTYTETTRVDARAQLTETIEKDNADEAMAYDIANQYAVFKQLMGGGSRV